MAVTSTPLPIDPKWDWRNTNPQNPLRGGPIYGPEGQRLPQPIAGVDYEAPPGGEGDYYGVTPPPSGQTYFPSGEPYTYTPSQYGYPEPEDYRPLGVKPTGITQREAKGGYEPGWGQLPSPSGYQPSRPGGYGGGGLGTVPLNIPPVTQPTETKVGQNIPTIPVPTMGPMPTFNIPEWSESRISSLTQAGAGPGLRELRRGVREAMGRYYQNPNVKRMSLREAMAGYGAGLEKVMAGARAGAVSEYGAEYEPQYRKAQAEYQTGVQTQLSQYQNAWNDYINRMQRVQTGGPWQLQVPPTGYTQPATPPPGYVG